MPGPRARLVALLALLALATGPAAAAEGGPSAVEACAARGAGTTPFPGDDLAAEWRQTDDDGDNDDDGDDGDRARGDDLEALEALEKAAARGERARRAGDEIRRTVLAAAQGAWPEVLRSAQHADALLARDPALRAASGARLARCLRAKALLHVGDKPRAHEALVEVLEESAWRSPPWRERQLREDLGSSAGRMAFERGLAHEAIEIYARVLREAPASLQANKGLGLAADALLALAQATSGQQGADDALAVDALAVDVDREALSPAARYMRRYLSSPQRRRDGSVDPAAQTPAGVLSQRVLHHLQRAVAAGCEDAHVMVRVGALLADRQEWEEAARNLARAVRLWPSSAEAHVNLARVLRARSHILRHEFVESHAASRATTKLESDSLLRRAISHLQQAVWLLEGRPSTRLREVARARNQLARALLEANRPDEAAELLTPAAREGQGPEDPALLARARLEQGRVREAAEIVLREPAADAPLEVEAPVRLLQGEVALARGALVEAQDAFSRADAIARELPTGDLADDLRRQGLVGLAKVALAAGDHASAEGLFQAALQLAEDDAEANLGLARTLVAQGLAQQAADYFWAAFQGRFESNLGSPQAHIEAARALAAVPEKHDEACAVLQAAATLWPRETEAIVMLARIARSKTVAMVAWQRALRANPECRDCLLELGTLHMDSGRLHRALESFAAAHRIDHAHAATHLLTGRAQAHLGHLDQAQDSFEAAILLAEGGGDTPAEVVALEARIDLATVQVRIGAPARSLELLHEAVALDPRSSIVHRSLALLLAAQGQPALAKEHEAEAARLSQWSEALVGLPLRAPGLALGQAARVDGATKAAANNAANRTVPVALVGSRVAIAAKEGVPLSHDVGGLVSLGLMFATNRDLDAAADCFEHVVAYESSPLAAVAELELGVVLLSMGDRHMALHHFARATARLDADQPAHLRAMLWTAHAEGDAKRLALLRRAATLHPHEPAALHALGVELAARPEIAAVEARDAFLEAISGLARNDTRPAADTFYRLARLYEQRHADDLETVADYLTRVLAFTSRAHRARAVAGRDEVASSAGTTTPKTAGGEASERRGAYPWSWAFETIDAMHAKTLLELGSVLRRLGRPQDASDLLVDAIDVGAGMPALRELSYVYAADGQLGPALWFARVSAQDPVRRDKHLLRALRAAGQAEEAARLANDTDVLEARGLLDEALEAARGDATRRAQLARIVAARSRARAAAEYAGELATFDEDVGRAVEAIVDLDAPGERAYALVYALQHATRRAQAALAATPLARAYCQNSSAVALAVGVVLLGADDGAEGEWQTWAEATTTLTLALGEEYSPLGSTDKGVDAFAAHLLVAEHLGTRGVRGGALMSRTTAQVHAHLARLFWRQARPLSAAMHAWWALAGRSRGGPVDDAVVREMHTIAAWACHAASAKVSPTLAPRVRAAAMAHFEGAKQASGRAMVFAWEGQPRAALEVLPTVSPQSGPCELAARGVALSHPRPEDPTEDAMAAFAEAVRALSHAEDVGAVRRRPLEEHESVRDPETAYCHSAGILTYANQLQRQGRGEDAAAALGVLLKKVDLDADQLAQTLYALGSLQFHLGRFDEAVRHLSHPLLLNHIGAANNLGAVLIKRGEYERAVRLLDGVLILCDERAARVDLCKQSARVNLALANEELGRVDAAIIHARSALKVLDEGLESGPAASVDPVAKEQNSAESARTSAAAGFDLRPVLACQLARLYRATNRVGLAVRILRGFPTDLEAMRLMGSIVADSGQLGEAVRVFRKVLLLHLNNTALSVMDALPTKQVLAHKVQDARVLMDLANAYFRTNQFAEAEALFEVVAETFATHASSAENNLGVIAFSKGFPQEAATHFRRALSLDADNEAAAMALAHLSQHRGESALGLQD